MSLFLDEIVWRPARTLVGLHVDQDKEITVRLDFNPLGIMAHLGYYVHVSESIVPGSYDMINESYTSLLNEGKDFIFSQSEDRKYLLYEGSVIENIKEFIESMDCSDTEYYKYLEFKTNDFNWLVWNNGSRYEVIFSNEDYIDITNVDELKFALKKENKTEELETLSYFVNS